MMTLPHNAQLMENLLQEDLENTTHLAILLEKERTALEKHDLEVLQTTVDEKIIVLQEIESNIKSRQLLLQQVNLTANMDDFQHFLNTLPTESANRCRELSDQLQLQLDDCHILNTINGKIVHRSRQSVARLLNIIRGQIDTTSNTYTAQGNNQEIKQQRPIAKA